MLRHAVTVDCQYVCTFQGCGYGNQSKAQYTEYLWHHCVVVQALTLTLHASQVCTYEEAVISGAANLKLARETAGPLCDALTNLVNSNGDVLSETAYRAMLLLADRFQMTDEAIAVRIHFSVCLPFPA